MFLKTGELKKIMKASLKKSGLIVGNVCGRYLVHAEDWGVYVEHAFASNKFKAAIMELIGDLPESDECYLYKIGADKELKQEIVADITDPYERWKQAKDYGVITPIILSAWPHIYIVCQKKSDYQFIMAKKSLTADVISTSELDTTSESMPGRPSIGGAVLYFKNESTIYWVHTESPGHRTLEVLFPHLDGISFFEDDWKRLEEDGEKETEDDEAADEELPY